ncbi:MAG: hypothetical protein ACR2J8_00870, partial [Thermomicrobiales bacterium]
LGERASITLSPLPVDRDDLSNAIAGAFSNIPGIRLPIRFDRYSEADSTASITVSILHDPGREVGGEVIERLRRQFPGASIVIERSI